MMYEGVGLILHGFIIRYKASVKFHTRQPGVLEAVRKRKGTAPFGNRTPVEQSFTPSASHLTAEISSFVYVQACGFACVSEEPSSSIRITSPGHIYAPNSGPNPTVLSSYFP
jgi:hypothetical protein